MNTYRVIYIIVSLYPFYHVKVPATLGSHAYHLEHIVSERVILETMDGKLRNQISPSVIFSNHGDSGYVIIYHVQI